MNFTCIILLVLSIRIVYSDEIPNCLRDNSQALDGSMSIMDVEDKLEILSEDDFHRRTTLFFTRYKQAHQQEGFQSGSKSLLHTLVSRNQLKKLFKSISNFLDTSNTPLKLFLQDGLSIFASHERFPEGRLELYYRFLNNSSQKVNLKKPKTILGLYLFRFEESLSAINKVFGQKGESDLPIGTAIRWDEFVSFFKSKNKDQLLFFQRMDFISFFLFPPLNIDPKDSANQTTFVCSELAQAASLLNISGEKLCSVYYPSTARPYGYVTNNNDTFIGLLNFQQFWCSIVNEVSTNNRIPRIAMATAFDRDDPHPTNFLKDGGWWRRTHQTLYEPNAFVEKIEEIPSDHSKLGTCRKTCESCLTNDDCCVGPCEHPNSSRFHVFRNRSRVCRYKDALCDEDIPLTLTNSNNNNSIPEKSASQNNYAIYPEFVYILTFTLLGLTFIIVISGFCIKKYLSKATATFLTPDELYQFEHGKQSQSRPSDEEMEMISLEDVECLPYDKTIEIKRENFQIYKNEILGSGEFGIVFKGRIRHEEVVAVKTTSTSKGAADNMYLKSLLYELKLIYLGEHEHIVRLQGAYTLRLASGKLYVFLEFCPLGNLLGFIRNRKESLGSHEQTVDFPNDEEINPKMFLSWSTQLANALCFMATKKVVHGDIAARNILVVNTNKIKLTDFGLSKRLYEYSMCVKEQKQPSPWRHMAIESLRDSQLSCQSDIWSFGVTMWEIYTMGEIPYAGLCWSHDFIKSLVDGQRLQCPELADPTVYKIMKSCWELLPEERPRIDSIFSELSSMTQNDHWFLKTN